MDFAVAVFDLPRPRAEDQPVAVRVLEDFGQLGRRGARGLGGGETLEESGWESTPYPTSSRTESPRRYP